MAAELISQSEFARRLGVSRQYIYKLVKNGKIKRVDGKIDFEESSKALENLSDPTRTKPSKKDDDEPPSNTTPPKAGQPPTFGEAKTMREVYAARLAKLRYEQESGSLVNRKDVEDRARDIAASVKINLMSLPSKLMEELAVISDPREINNILDKEIRMLLSEMADQLRK